MTIAMDTPFTCLYQSKIQLSQTNPAIGCKFYVLSWLPWFYFICCGECGSCTALCGLYLLHLTRLHFDR